MTSTRHTEWRHGRNWIRAGDTVHVRSSPGKRDGHDARFLYADVNDARTDITVVGARGFRTYPAERIERRAQATLARKGRDQERR